MKNDTIRMIFSVLGAAAAFLLLFFLLHWELAVCALLGIGLYFGFFFLLKPSRKIGGIDVESLPDGKELQRLLDEAQADLAMIEKSKNTISNIPVRSNAEKLHETGRRILDYLNENPDKIKLARKFLTYYLDTASKLLERYVQFQETGLRSAEVREILSKTEEALPVLNQAFERQFTHLMEGELLDVEVDIDLLKNILEMEGGK